MSPAGEYAGGAVPGRLDGLWFGVVEVDADGIVHSVSRAVRDAVGAETPAVGAAPPVEAGWWQAALANQDRNAAEVRNSPHRHITADGRLLWLRVQAVPGRDDGWLTVVVEDVTDEQDEKLELAGDAALRSRLAAELDRANDRLARTNAELQRFAGAVAHDLKGPLTNILGFSQLIPDVAEDLGADGIEIVGRLERNARRSSAMVSDLLAYARTAGSPTDHETIDLDAVVRWAIDTKRNQLDGVDADVRIGPLPEILGNEAALRQVFLNLVDNATKYCRPGVPLVLDIRQVASTQPDLVEVVVADNGVGIPADERERIFELGVRGTAEVDGSGIGLASCAGVLQSLGGTIVATEPSDGVGAVFVIQLPHAAALDVPLAVDGRVMVVDDDADVRQIVGLLARSVGLEVVSEATGAQAAIEWFTASPVRPDIVVLDLALGDGDGLEVARVLLELEPDVRVMIHSGLIDDAVAAAARRIGVVEIVGKDSGSQDDFTDALRRLARSG